LRGDDFPMTFLVLTHGGTGSKPSEKGGTDRAAEAGLAFLRRGLGPLEAAVEACRVLEDDPRFNAGTGSSLRFDGKTIEMDAACMDSDGRFGAVAALRDVKNPILVARELLPTPHNLLAGEGALRYARAHGHESYNPWTQRAQDRYDRFMERFRNGMHDRSESEWHPEMLREHWNYDISLSEILDADTVGAVATDGRTYAAALSTGGTMATLLGRVGDVPIPGCGLHAGPAGAVAVTGDGDHLARAFLASRIYADLEAGLSPDEARDRAIARFPGHVDVGVILVSPRGWSGGSNRDMAWSALAKEVIA